MSPISALFFFLLLLNPISAQPIPEERAGFLDDPMMGNIAKKMITKFSSFLTPQKDLEVVGDDWDYYDEDVAPGNITKIVEEKIRQCTCTEAKECIVEGFRYLSNCRLSCESHLKYFGVQTSEFSECFPKNSGEAEALNQCLKKGASNFCSANAVPQFITKPIYDPKKSSNVDSDLDIAKLTGISIIEHWNSFHSCTDGCLKNKILECFESKKCGIKLPTEYNLGKISDFCPPIKNSRQSSVMKTLSCFTIQRLFSKFLN